MFRIKNKGSVYDTASAQVIQVVNLNVSPGIIPIEIDSELQVNYLTTKISYYLDSKLIVKVLSKRQKLKSILLNMLKLN